MMFWRPALPINERIDWSKILQDLSRQNQSRHGMTLQAVSDATGIPVSTLNGYKNLDVEPKHADGERLLALWWKHMAPILPTKKGGVRQRRVTK